MIPAMLAIAAGTTAASMLNKPKDRLSPYLQAALDEISKVQVPDAQSLQVKLQQLVQQGVMSPEQAKASLVEYNAFDNTAPDATARGAQMSALQGLQDQINNGGLTDTTRSQIQHTLDDVNNAERGQQGAIMEDAHRRGISGSGIELANKLMSQQNAANMAGKQGMDIAAMAEQAKAEALKSAAALGGQIEGQDYSEQAQKASAQNTINQFNATNQQQVTMQNIAARNAAQAANLAEKQRVADTNTNMENANRVRNTELIHQNFNDKLDKAKAVAGALGGQGQAAQSASNANTAWNANLIGGVNNALTTYGAGGGFNSAPNPNVSNVGGGYTTLTGTDRDKYKPLGYAHGGVVPGKAPFPGDDARNDTVDAKLSPGEVVLPRSETQEPSEYDKFMGDMPRSEQKPTADAVRLVLEALSGMGC
jgi:hypothetical protein